MAIATRRASHERDIRFHLSHFFQKSTARPVTSFSEIRSLEFWLLADGHGCAGSNANGDDPRRLICGGNNCRGPGKSHGVPHNKHSPLRRRWPPPAFRQLYVTEARRTFGSRSECGSDLALVELVRAWNQTIPIGRCRSRCSGFKLSRGLEMRESGARGILRTLGCQHAYLAGQELVCPK
ncbi:hypothetical protein GCM10009595_12900 [Falsarthrobacter nasiphocae]